MNDQAAAAGPAVADRGPATQFYIPATASLHERRPRTLKHGNTFAVFDHYGDAASVGGPEGIYHNDTRFLSRLELRINGRQPLLLSSTVQMDNAALVVDLTNPDLMEEGRLALVRDTIHIHRLKFLWEAACYERIAVLNFSEGPQRVRLDLHFAADFADIFEIRGQRRTRRGWNTAERVNPSAASLRYKGLDGVLRETCIRFDPAPSHLDTTHAAFDLALAPKERFTLFVQIGCGPRTAEWSGRVFFADMRKARRLLHRSSSRAAAVESSHDLFNQLVCRSISDLYMLITDTDAGPYPYAGIPWFSTVFGRDGLITALLTLWLDPAIAKGVLGFLASKQATEFAPARDAEPGKILHEMRSGEMARLHEVPFGLYYGSIDSTPLFVLLAGEYFRRTGDIETIRSLWPNIEAALAWIDRFGDVDGDGFVEYRRKSESGLDNQGWKDSRDAIFHADGRLAEPPIALCEVQAYVYGAKSRAASMARALGLQAVAARLDHEAQALRERFEQAFWCEDLGTYALALDGNKQPCRVRTSNAGHALYTGIAAPERAVRVAVALMGRTSFSGWGIRTVASTEARYNPMSYHNGAVWPHDNAIIALGFARYGLKDHVARLTRAIFDASIHMDLQRLPELFCGFQRTRRRGPTFYPVACAPQAWASATPFALLQANLGLGFDLGARQITFNQPRLPDFLDRIELRNLRLGRSAADVLIQRSGSDVSVSVLRRQGDVKVSVVH
ncbi:MAG TPA: amylo-alpha-1,6-glucosidase [Alphaproteobacteria bacterium]